MFIFEGIRRTISQFALKIKSYVKKARPPFYSSAGKTAERLAIFEISVRLYCTSSESQD
jgi:hypothetical protein